ncbi:MAG: DUF309 domain-containing protein [Jatrophihabitantaceae bacterium]
MSEQRDDPAGRDRDKLGRPRNARPRDALGRPLRYGAAGVARQVENPQRSPQESLAEAQRLLDAGRPFEAHEVLEDAWKAAPAAERELWRGLAQLAVGLTHAARGNHPGAVTLIARGAANLVGYAEGDGYHDRPPHRVDVPGLLAWSAAVAAPAPDGTSPAVAGLGPPRLTTLS